MCNWLSCRCGLQQAERPSQVVTWTATQRGLVTLAFDLLTVKLVQNVISGTNYLPANFGVSVSFRCRIMGEHASNWRRYNLDLWSSRSPLTSMMRPSHSIRLPSLKFVGFHVPKMWLIFDHGRPGGLDLWPSDL